MEELLGQELANVITQANTISGSDYLRIFKIASEAGFSNQQLQEFLRSKNIEIKSPEPPRNEAMSSMKLH